jgi:hypothetical protein
MHQELNLRKNEKINFEQKIGPCDEMEEKLEVKETMKKQF